MKEKNLFETLKKPPLAFLLRPGNFQNFIGQKHLVGQNGILKNLIQKDEISSLIFWGPPGCGKTSLAYLISKITKAKFIYISAVSAKLEDLKKIINQAQLEKTILVIDEVHRWNRAQQAALLPYVEDGTLTLIGCTTENPFFEVISPLISRSTVYKLNPLSGKELEKILCRAIKVLKNQKIRFDIDENALKFIIEYASGDARKALNTLESAISFIKTQKFPKITLKIIEQVIQKRTILYDKDRDQHYDTISAFIKSMRGSDPDAAIFYLVKMISAGEDPKFMARRMLILASEDIGNADPNAVQLANACFEAVEKVGLPEAEFALAQAALYLATAPKSNAVYKALARSKKDLQQKGPGEVPLHLRNPAHPGLKQFQYGENYQYAHLYKQAYVPEETYLPRHLKGQKYYFPSDRGYEKIIKARLKYWRSLTKNDPAKDLNCPKSENLSKFKPKND